MTRKNQKDEEIEICKMFLSAYDLEVKDLDYKLPSNEGRDKFDVMVNIKTGYPELKFQVKIIQFHPNDKTQQQYNDEIGWVRAYKKGNTNPRMHIYNHLGSSWQTAIKSTLENLNSKDIYSERQRMNIDLLLLLNDSSLPNDSTYNFTELKQFGYRSINVVHYGRKTSTVLGANSNAPEILKNNEGIERKCLWIPE